MKQTTLAVIAILLVIYAFSMAIFYLTNTSKDNEYFVIDNIIKQEQVEDEKEILQKLHSHPSVTEEEQMRLELRLEELK